MERELLRRKEAAAFLGVSVTTIDNWVRRGELKPVYHGSIPFFRRDELLKSN